MRPKTVKDIDELLDDPEKFNALLDEVRDDAYKMAVSHILYSLPKLIKDLNGFYGEVDKEAKQFFIDNPKLKRVKEPIRRKAVMLAAVYPHLGAKELLDKAAEDFNK